MPFYDDHPVRHLMRQASLPRIELARAAGVTYGAVDKLMMGMTKSVHPEIARVLAKETGVPVKRIRELVAAWNETPILEKLPPRARATLSLDPADIARFYGSFLAWREEFAENPTQFASILRVPRATLVEYEEERRRGFPPTMHAAIVKQFAVTPEYVDALAGLPPSHVLAREEPTATVVSVVNRETSDPILKPYFDKIFAQLGRPETEETP